MKQFFYTRREPIAPKEGETELTFKNFKDSFAMDAVLRTSEYAEGKIVIYLKDGHEEAADVQKDVVDKNGKVTGKETKRERGWYMSQILLSEEDTKRFWEIFS